MNHKPTNREIAYAEEIWHRALRNEDLSSYSDDELDNVFLLVLVHSNHLTDELKDIDTISKAKKAVNKEIDRRSKKKEGYSKFNWAIIGALLGVVISQLFNYFFNQCK
jgi:hypothetical protein